ncbi:molybdopterin oxidoreductase family protein [Anaerosalibacter massiliensis]|uniref:Molybdopterin-dependent oxidoreductase n=1 Tax=Anaerosalibacter massiliensis TaxID=1347392 RepID=A0A9X2MHE3_9FIRM|nr:molybdopterin-dependent oxidoreductase [Anaerosalibacter massiliensis]MCR2043684.1 molybdopterin-dependent oxidoreductase [Anaerosalibacter massiliensis]
MEVKQSTCNYCSIGCNLDFYVEDNKIRKIIPTKNHTVNKGFCCIKGLQLNRQESSRRLPLLRGEDGVMREVSWDKAFETFSSRMKEIQNKYGKESVAYLSTAQITTEELALLGFVGRTYMGINGDGNTRLCMATAAVAHNQSFGYDSPPYALKDLELSDTIIFIGANPIVTHPVLWEYAVRNKDAKIISIDPRKSETTIKSDIWIDIKPKSDIRLFYTLANVLIEKNWIDKEYIEKYSEDFQEFKEHVNKYTLDGVEEKTGISKKRVLELAEIIHKGKKVSFWWTMGVNQGYQAVRTAQSIINLAVMTGNIGREGTGANSITGQCNAMGSRLYSNTTCLYGGRNYNNLEDRKEVANILDIDESILPTKPTISYGEIIDRINSGEIKGLWVIATNPRHSSSDNMKFAKAINNLEFLVVQDLYDDTDTAQHCDLFLPSVPGTKKQGTLINTERRLSAVTPVLEREEGELSDYEIFLGIGKALGIEEPLEKWNTPRDAFELIKQFSKGMPGDITGVDYNMIVNSNGVQWPFKKGDRLIEDERRLFEDNKYYTPSGKVKFIYEDIMEIPNPITKEYPYVLNTGRTTVGQWHTQTRTSEIPIVEDASIKQAHLLINVELANQLGIKESDKIIVSAINGEKGRFIAKLSRNVKKYHLFAPIHYIETNALTPSIFDTYSKEPSYKYMPVNIKKVAK